MKYLITILIIVAFPLTELAAQQKHYYGRVQNEAGEPLNGASLDLENYGRTLITTENGAFRTTIEADSLQVTVRMLGYRSMISILYPDEDMVLTLERQDQSLQEVEIVSTGYETLSRERATGSFSTLNEEQLSRQVSPDIVGMMDGMANALLFDRRSDQYNMANASIRGVSTMFANSTPLIVLDNFPYEGDLNLINPNTVESVTILKDAAAASIWGTRAANGVIVITTKKGKLDAAPTLEFNSNFTYGEKPDIGRLQWIGSQDFIDVERMLFDRGFYNAQERNASRPLLSPVVERLISNREGLLDDASLESELRQLSSYDLRDDFSTYLYQPSQHQQYSFNMRGGSSNLAYALSLGYDDQTSVLNAKSNRLVIRTENTYRPTKNLDVSLGLTYTRDRDEQGRPPYSSFGLASGRFIYPYARLADEVGNPLPIARNYRQTMLDEAEENGLLDWYDYPLREMDLIDNVQHQQDILLNASVAYQLPFGIRAQVRYQYQQLNSTSNDLRTTDLWFTRNEINRFTQVTDGGLIRPVPEGSITINSNGQISAQQFRAQLDYNKSWDRHQLDAIAGFEARERTSQNRANRIYGFNEQNLTLVNVDYATLFPQYHNQNLRARIAPGNSFSDLTSRFVSYFANGAYSFDERYTLSASMRRDGSNIFGVNTNQRFVPLWSIGGAWSTSNEAFYKAEWLPYLRFRLTYGYNGNVDNSLTAFTTFVYLSNNLNNQPYGNVQTPPNPSLRWEKTGVWNLGMDFATKGDRVRGSIEYYRKNGVDLIGDAPLDPTLGVRRPTGESAFRGNVASMRGQGIDVEVVTQNTNGLFRWNSTWLFSYAVNKVTDYDVPLANATTYLQGGFGINPVIGRPLQHINAYRFEGLDPANGNPLGYLNGETTDNHGQITSQSALEDLVYMGNAVPPFFGAFRNDFSIKNWTLSVNLTYRLGYYYRRSTISYGNLFNGWRGHSDFEQRWQQPGDEQFTHVPSMVYPNVSVRDAFYGSSEPVVESGSHIRLKDVRLNYTVAAGGIGRLPIKQLQVYTYANNLGILWRKGNRWIDPDTQSEIPLPRTYSLGIKAVF